MKSLREFPAILLHRDPIDFRKGIYTLAAYVQGVMVQNPTDGTLYVFCNRARSALKCLYWDKSGFAMWVKVLERQRFAWPKTVAATQVVLTHDQLEWLLQGFDILKMKPFEEVDVQNTF